MSVATVREYQCDICGWKYDQANLFTRIRGLDLCYYCTSTGDRGMLECGEHRITLTGDSWICACGSSYETFLTAIDPIVAARILDYAPAPVAAAAHLHTKWDWP